ncbi:MAG: YbhB/YbcL family Raf kinase inhibitor-like protein [Candidatus Thermoplasmatota archaeon]|jgi:hypothetical protein|nr:YbhB/YbcL family Raf kinase inhibitor-like protein [Candidatus Thermoplasmatota archaeon]
MTFKIDIPAFKYGADIDKKFTCEGEDISPQIKWEDEPASTKSYILTVEDPDAPGGTFIHWVMYNIPPTIKEIPENIPKTEATPQGFTQGKNSFGKIGYNGPCPPKRSKHRYFFFLYATLVTEKLPPGLARSDLEKIIEDKTIKRVTFMGQFGR